MPYNMPDTDILDLQTAIQAAIEAQSKHPITQRIPVWFDGRIVAWYTVTIEREPIDKRI